MPANVETLKDQIKTHCQYWQIYLFTAFDLQNTSEHFGRDCCPGRISDEGSFVSFLTFPTFLCPLAVAAAASANCFSCGGLSSSLTGAA